MCCYPECSLPQQSFWRDQKLTSNRKLLLILLVSPLFYSVYYILLHWRSRCGRSIWKLLVGFICPKRLKFDLIKFICMFQLCCFGVFFTSRKAFFFFFKCLSNFSDVLETVMQNYIANMYVELLEFYHGHITNYINNSPSRSRRSSKFIVLCHWYKRINYEFV